MTLSLGTVASRVDLEGAIDLADRVFFQGTPSFGLRYPRAFALENAPNLAIAKDGTQVVAVVAGYPAQLRLAEGLELKTLAVGAVCTEAAYRGRGLAAELLALIRDQAALSGTDILLISGTGQLYTSMGAREVGHLFETHISFDGDVMPCAPYERHEYPGPSIIRTAWAAHEQEAVRFRRTSSEFASLLRGHLSALDGEACALLTVPEEPGYAVVRSSREGADRVGFLVEYAGDSAVMLACAAAEAKAQGCNRFFTRSSSPLMTGHGARTLDIPMTGTMLVVSPFALLRKLGIYLSRGEEPRLCKAHGDGTYEMHVGDEFVFRGSSDDIAPHFWGAGLSEQSALLPSFRTDNLNFL